MGLLSDKWTSFSSAFGGGVLVHERQDDLELKRVYPGRYRTKKLPSEALSIVFKWHDSRENPAVSTLRFGQETKKRTQRPSEPRARMLVTFPHWQEPSSGVRPYSRTQQSTRGSLYQMLQTDPVPSCYWDTPLRPSDRPRLALRSLPHISSILSTFQKVS